MQITWFCVVGQMRPEGNGLLRCVEAEERLECEAHVDGIHLEHVSEFKYLECFGQIR